METSQLNWGWFLKQLGLSSAALIAALDKLPEYEKYMLIPLLKGAAENEDLNLFEYILNSINEEVYICPSEFKKMLKWIIMNKFIDRLKLIFKKWTWLKNDEDLDSLDVDEDLNYFLNL